MFTLINQCSAFYNWDRVLIYAPVGRAVRVTVN